jgi:inositol 1,4,5-triphosphate receptor type 3
MIGGTKIIIILIWEENESDNEYIIQLLVLLKELMHRERAKKSA